MSIEIYLYTIFTLLAVYVLNGVNFQAFMKTNRVIETKLLVLMLSFGISYLLTSFVMGFIG